MARRGARDTEGATATRVHEQPREEQWGTNLGQGLPIVGSCRLLTPPLRSFEKYARARAQAYERVSNAYEDALAHCCTE